MTDSDDKLARRYRELEREEPRGVIDAAILAASRRAVAPPSWSRRWAAPVSIAAVLVLAFGLTLEMQHEKPDLASPATEAPRPAIETPPPPKESAPSLLSRDAASQARPDARGVSPPAKPAAPERRAAKAASAAGRAVTDPSALAKEAPAVREEKLAAPVVNDEAKREASVEMATPFPAQRANLAPAAPATAAAGAPARSAASPMAAPVTASPPPAAQPQPSMQSKERMAAPRFKAESADAVSPAASADIERELERIAKLRAEGRDTEADKALEEFRRLHPDYPIAGAMWDRVRRR